MPAISSSLFDMFFYIVCALLLLNAITTEAAAVKPCLDEEGSQFCVDPFNHDLCGNSGFRHFAEKYCAETCGLCY